jgi:predicted nucleic acid-binding protein
MYLLDTDICIEFLRNNKKVVGLIRGFKELHISAVTLSELFFGIYNSNNEKKHKAKIADFLSNVSLLETNFSISNNFGKIKTSLKNKGFLAGDFDMMNAAFALTYDMTLVTRNIRHFKNIDGIKLRTI